MLITIELDDLIICSHPSEEDKIIISIKGSQTTININDLTLALTKIMYK